MAKGSQSVRTATKKNTPFSGARSGDATAGKQRLRPMEPARQKDVPYVPHGSSLNEDALSRRDVMTTRTEHRTFYDDPISVRQWAAETDPNTPVDFAGYGYPSASQSVENATFCAAPSMPGAFPAFSPSVSYVPFPISSGIQDNEFGAGYPVSMLHGLPQSSRNALSLDTCNDMDSMKHYEACAYPTPTAEEMTYSTSTASYVPYYGGGQDFEPRYSSWPSGTFLPEDEASQAMYPHGSNGAAWSPVLGTDPSVSSSYSRSSYLAMQPNTPLSPLAQEPSWPAGQGHAQEEDLGLCPTFSLGEAFSLPAGCRVDHDDGMSTLKPTRSAQRAPIGGMDMWTQEDSHPAAFAGPSFVDLTYARRPSDNENATTAREHPLYRVGPKEDGLYHCPFAGSEYCTHKAEKLKCNYDKHLDSHLKPYHCKVQGCEPLAFSSTACLLRHEREAHGMHGHGDKPHLCTYRECERSIPGNGFPRRWNLFDHMRRVHNYTGPSSPPGSTSPTPSSASSVCHGQATLAIRKRRTSGSAKGEAMKKTKSNSSSRAAAPGAVPKKQLQSMQLVWHKQKAAINARMASLDPTDTMAMEQINADCAMLQTMADNIRRQETTQLVY